MVDSALVKWLHSFTVEILGLIGGWGVSRFHPGAGTEPIRCLAVHIPDAGIFAVVTIGAGGAIRRVADSLFGGEFIAGVGLGDGFDGRSWDDASIAIYILRGYLEGVEHDACAAVVDAARAEGIEDLSEGDLDGAAVFKDRKPEVVHHSDGLRGVEAVKARVEVAVRFVSQSRGFALGSVGHDVAAFV